jgi:hypothetical protein
LLAGDLPPIARVAAEDSGLTSIGSFVKAIGGANNQRTMEQSMAGRALRS